MSGGEGEADEEGAGALIWNTVCINGIMCMTILKDDIKVLV